MESFKFTQVLGLISLLLVSGYATICSSGCCCNSRYCSRSFIYYTAYCNFQSNSPFSGGIADLFFNKSISRSTHADNRFLFYNLLMPVWRRSDSEAIAAAANDQSTYIEINLSRTRTALIGNGALEPLANFTIKKLILNDLPLVVLPNNVFTPLGHLEVMDISNFEQGTSEGHFFHSTRGLTSLKVSNSEAFVIKDIINGDHRLYSLQYLDLRSNNLAAISKFVFSRMTKLQSIQFENNLLVTIPEFNFAPTASLQFVHFENNRLETLPEYLFASTSSVQAVHFENNRLTTLPECIFSPLTSLHSFHLENNQLTEFEVDICPFFFNRTSTAFINIYLENNYICNFDYVIDSFRRCVLTSNNVGHLHIRAANNYYCNALPVYVSLASGQSLTISIIGTCKSIPSTPPPQCVTKESTNVTSATATTSSTQNSTTTTSVTSQETTTSPTQSSTTTTSVMSKETTTSPTQSSTTTTSVMSKETTTSSTQSSTNTTSVTSKETTTSSTQSSTTTTSVASKETTTSSTQSSTNTTSVTSKETTTSSTQSSTTTTSVASKETTTSSTQSSTTTTSVMSKETTKSPTQSFTTATTTVTFEKTATSQTQPYTTESMTVTSKPSTMLSRQSSTTESTRVASKEVVMSPAYSSTTQLTSMTSEKFTTLPKLVTTRPSIGALNLAVSKTPHPSHPTSAPLGSSALVGMTLGSVAVAAAVVVGIVCGVRRCSGANARSLQLKEAQYYTDLQQDAITRPQSGYINPPAADNVGMAPLDTPPIPPRDDTSADTEGYDDATSTPRIYYEAVP